MEEEIAVPFRTTVTGIATCCASWTSLYLMLCALWPSRKAEWHCREVTLLHAVTVVIMSAWCGFIQGPWPFTDPGGPSTPLQHWTCVVCLGYFLFDLTWCLYHKTEGAVMLCHHIISIMGLCLVVFRGHNGTEMIATIFGSEFTNPLLQAKWFLRSMERQNTWYALIIDFLFMALFGFLRIGVASYLLYCHFNHPRPDVIAKAGGLAIYIIGWLFWIMIVRYGIKKCLKLLNKGKNSSPSHSSSQEKTSNGKHAHNGRVENGSSR